MINHHREKENTTEGHFFSLFVALKKWWQRDDEDIHCGVLGFRSTSKLSGHECSTIQHVDALVTDVLPLLTTTSESIDPFDDD